VLGKDPPDAAQSAGDEVHAVLAQWRAGLQTARLETLDEARAVAVGNHRFRGIGLDLGGQARRAGRIDIHHAAANRRELLRDNPRQGGEWGLFRAFDTSVYWLNTEGDYRQARFRRLWPEPFRDLQQAVEADFLRLFEGRVVCDTGIGVQAPQVNDVLGSGVEPIASIIFDSQDIDSGALQLVRKSVADVTSVHENDAASSSSRRCRAKGILDPGWCIEPLRWVA
jgi:hypothetical protein